MIDIPLLVFIITIVGDVAALFIDIMLLNTGQQTISQIAQTYRIWAVIFVLWQIAGAIGLAVHLL